MAGRTQKLVVLCSLRLDLCQCLLLIQRHNREATTKLINLFFQSCAVKVVYFNDPKITRVMRRFKHDNHFHVTIFE